MDYTPFAEIEIESSNSRNADGSEALRFFSSVAPPQPIKPRIIDPVREKFYEMRKLASVRPFARNSSELFYRQAKFMEDFRDDYDGNAKFNMYYPCYQNMGYEYLRTYFTWRTKVRDGDIQPTSLSYIYLYIYELLSGIGTCDPADGLKKLLALWNDVSFKKPGVEKYLPKWLKDYHIFYILPDSFSDFVEKNNMQKYFSLSLLFDESAENKLEIWNSISGYDVTNSKFYKDGNEQLLNDCFSAVYHAVQGFCIKRNTRLEDLLVYSVSRRSPWQPFKQALFDSRIKQPDREIKINEFERYYCKNGQWTANLPVYYSSQKDFVGYIIKKTEACLRNSTGYKYKLVAEMKSGSKPFRELQRPAAKRAELDKVIEKAVTDFYNEQNRTVVTVDYTNLARIREEALETQGSLIVEDDLGANLQDRGTVHLSCSDIKQYENAELRNKTDEPSPCLAAPESPPLTLSFADGWKALKNALTDVERQALSLALQENADIKTFATNNGLMLEVLADSINEKATDFIGDSLLEIDDVVVLYDEYRVNVEALCKIL
ncbi:MAG: TerB N-terminal domain-containing protein [Oscillospiraceae bacterium]|nr:TerB N-terminal domain-containing protein [Oscillospiraceae bacterium]